MTGSLKPTIGPFCMPENRSNRQMDVQQQGASAVSDTAQQQSASATQQNGDAQAAKPGDDTQHRINEAAEAARKEERAKIKREQDAAEAKRKQDELAAKGEFETVANQLRNEVASVSSERDSAMQQRDAYAAALAAVVKARIESVPGDKRAAVRKLVPDTLPLDQQLTQVEAAIELVGTTAPAPRGTGSNPPRAGSSDERAQRIEENKRQIRSAYSL
jgi:flagellar biosynthesis GTPase FlhF